MKTQFYVLILSFFTVPVFSKSPPDSVVNITAFFGHLQKEIYTGKPPFGVIKKKIKFDQSYCQLPDLKNDFEITQDSAINYLKENFERYALSQIWFHSGDSVVVSFWPKIPGFSQQKAFEAVRHENNGNVYKINPTEEYGTQAGIGIHLKMKNGKYLITKISYSESC